MKDQQQTLSVRISDALRRRLENAREMFGWVDGDSISISEVAKRFLESAKGEYIEASELMGRPTKTLLNIRRKWERGLSLSRPEWQVLGYYLQEGCEEMTEDPDLPTAESYAELLEAFVAALGIRDGAKNVFELDHYYLGNLMLSDSPGISDVNLESVIKVTRHALGKVKEARAAGSRAPKLVLIGRSLYVVFRDERLKGVEALNEVLRPYIRALFRIAARGHYLREGRPVREQLARDSKSLRPPQPPPVVVGDLRLSITIDETNEFSMLLDLGPHRVLYPLESYPVIREFAAMLWALKPGEQWTGREFFGYADRTGASFQFRRRINGITLTFSAEEWRALGEMVDKALALPEMQPVLEDAALAYGEI
jgi:hypothetical protein